MAFSPQETARALISNLRSAHASADELATAVDNVSIAVVQQRIESICSAMNGAHSHLQTLQGSFDNATIAARVANHLEPAPADIPAAYTTARSAWITMADHYGNTVIHDMATPWVWMAVDRKHGPRAYNLDSTPEFRPNLVALRDALAAFV